MDNVSIVIPAHNEGENLVDTVRCVLENTAYPDYEIVVVDDGSTDGSGDRLLRDFGNDGCVSVVRAQGVGVANARNLGAARATGEMLVFLDAHCYTPRNWLVGLTQPLAQAGVGMVGPAIGTMRYSSDIRGLGLTWRDASLELEWLEQREDTPYPVPLLCGACQAVCKADFERLGGYDTGMTRWGSEDEELCLRTWLMGYEVLVQPQTVIYHLFRDSHPYETQVQKIIYNRLRLALLHLSDDRVSRVLSHHRNIPGFDEIIDWLQDSDVANRRDELEALRCRDDDWLCTRFGCQI